jgi:HlyD family secretion protein
MSSAPAGARVPGFFRSNLRLIAAIVVVIALAGAFVAKRFQPLPVTVTPVVRGKAVDAVYATGTVEADDRVNVKAKTSGSIAQILVKEGDAVKKGDLLARIDNPVVTFDLKRGKADLGAASAQAGSDAPQIAALRAQARGVEAELRTTRAELDRQEELLEGGALAAAELDRTKSRVAQLEAGLAQNQAEQRALRIDLSANAARQAVQVESLTSRVADTEVRAPLDGVVLAKAIELGEVVTVNQPLFKVGDTRRLVLEVSVDEADVSKVHDGRDAAKASPAAISLYAFPNQIFKGHVFEILPDANRERKAFLVKVELDTPPPGLRSGMSAEVNIIAHEKDQVLLAPSEAEAGGAVWIARGGRATRRPIRVGIRDLLRLEVTEGLEEGDRVILDGQDKLDEGKRITATERLPDKLAPMPDQSQPGQTTLK